ncbi:MAG: acyl-CoA dehydrogenase family protein [Nitrososphaerota archaeon]|nr:acyl-CoA dehydrogenase family protein [Nitrososphaerota archaeon]MDG6978325.1 acyl-CoA dehydrogenase family protein [Nitrososphaerota archaeon]MDG7021564.1 acyl-CoA dehydrogenase family protein [Nitrososphaerota archaeon]
MEKTFARSVEDASRLIDLTEEDMRLFERVESACDDLVLPEFESYVARKFNDKIPEILRKHRLMGVPIAKRYGGEGARPLVHALTLERMGQLGLGAITYVDVHQALGSLTVQEWGNEEQKQRYLTKAATGEVVFAYALTEPEAGSDPSALKSTFKKEGSDYYVSGSKYLISNGSVANKLIVFALPEGQQKGVTAFLVDSKAPGFSVEMRMEEKMGLFTSDTSLLTLDGVKVPKEDVLGEEGKGLSVAYAALLNGRLGIASGCLGVMEDCINQVKERVTYRQQFGKPIAKHQLIQRHIATMVANFESSRWLVYQVAVKKEEYDNNRGNLEMRTEVDRSSAVAKYVASRAAYSTADAAVQCFGGFGYSILAPVTKHLLDTRVARIYEGTDEIMELKIASTVLGREYEAYK